MCLENYTVVISTIDLLLSNISNFSSSIKNHCVTSILALPLLRDLLVAVIDEDVTNLSESQLSGASYLHQFCNQRERLICRYECDHAELLEGNQTLVLHPILFFLQHMQCTLLSAKQTSICSEGYTESLLAPHCF